MRDGRVTPDWPRTTVDKHSGEGREWIHPAVPRYYLHHYPKRPDMGDCAGKWVVIDREADLADGRAFRRKADASVTLCGGMIRKMRGKRFPCWTPAKSPSACLVPSTGRRKCPAFVGARARRSIPARTGRRIAA